VIHVKEENIFYIQVHYSLSALCHSLKITIFN